MIRVKEIIAKGPQRYETGNERADFILKSPFDNRLESNKNIIQKLFKHSKKNAK